MEATTVELKSTMEEAHVGQDVGRSGAPTRSATSINSSSLNSGAMLVPPPPEKIFFPRIGMEIPPGISAPTVSLIDLVGSVDAYRTCRSQRRFQGKRILSSYRLCTTISATMQSCLSLFLPTSFRRGEVVRINFFSTHGGEEK